MLSRSSLHLAHSVFALERGLARAETARVYLMLGELRTSRAYKTQIPGDYINGN